MLADDNGAIAPVWASTRDSIVNNNQLDFSFVADLPVIDKVPTKRSVRAKPGAQPSLAPAAPAPLGLEEMAKALHAHPDYRVTRRLVPRLRWPSAVSGQDLWSVLILDTETTGLDHTKDKIIELAFVRVDIDRNTGYPVGDAVVYDELEDPGITIPKEIEGITGITQAMVSGRSLDEVRIAELTQNVHLVIAHNAAFDRPFVEQRLPQFKDLNWACSFADISWKSQGHSSAKLESLALAMGWFYDAHRAEMDCHALLAVLTVPLQAQARTGCAQLIEVAQQPSFRLQATNAPFDAKDKLKVRGYRWNAEQKVWGTRLSDVNALQAEYLWLKEHAYHQRGAVVQVEKLDACIRYSARPGEIFYHQL